METLTYDLKTLCELAGADVTPRTVHYYIQQGLLPHAATAGPKARYDRRHLGRLQLIKRLQREHQPLAEIRERLRRLTDDEIEQVLQQTPPPPPAREAPGSALEYIRQALGAPSPMPESNARQAISQFIDTATDAADSLAHRLRQAQAAVEPPVGWNRSQWDRIALNQDLELHVRRPLTREGNRKLERLLEAARAILKEEW